MSVDSVDARLFSAAYNAVSSLSYDCPFCGEKSANERSMAEEVEHPLLPACTICQKSHTCGLLVGHLTASFRINIHLPTAYTLAPTGRWQRDVARVRIVAEVRGLHVVAVEELLPEDFLPSNADTVMAAEEPSLTNPAAEWTFAQQDHSALAISFPSIQLQFLPLPVSIGRQANNSPAAVCFEVLRSPLSRQVLLKRL
ncbi:unnamed protein product [Schistocephalus solidus]|uniref:Uncharacterized protein n=1 Tax=Schistocephalus solidus TaxID=70667 RepID=A0A3P7CPZ5_SCHSO|nr:unnamed protein product [Schistocephalus solidus]